MARALVSIIIPGGFETSKTNFPSASGRRVSDRMGFPPGALGISHNCRTRLPQAAGIFWPGKTLPNVECDLTPSLAVLGSVEARVVSTQYGSLMMTAWRLALST